MKRVYTIGGLFNIVVESDNENSITREIEEQFTFYRIAKEVTHVLGFISQNEELQLPHGACELVKDLLYEDNKSLYITVGGVIKIDAQNDNFIIEYTSKSNGGMVFHVMEVLTRFYAPLYDIVFLHASGFIIDNRVTLINAFGGSGKTEVMLKALLDGARFIADDLAIVNKDGQVFPYTTLIPLRIHHYDDNLLAKLKVPKHKWTLANYCFKKNGRITRRIYNSLNLTYFVRNLPYIAFTDKKTPIKFYDVNHFYWVESSDTTSFKEIGKQNFYDKMVVCLENESRKYFDCDGFFRYKFPFFNTYKEKQNELLQSILEKVNIQGVTIRGRNFDELANLLFSNN